MHEEDFYRIRAAIADESVSKLVNTFRECDEWVGVINDDLERIGKVQRMQGQAFEERSASSC